MIAERCLSGTFFFFFFFGFVSSLMWSTVYFDSLCFCCYLSDRALLLLPSSLCGDGTEEGASGWTPGPVSSLQSNK